MMFIVRAYGPNWRYTVRKQSKFLWHLEGLYEFGPRSGKIVVPWWNKKRRPIRALKEKP